MLPFILASLGKRTKFQRKELPQMKLNIQIDENRNPENGNSTQDLPFVSK